jgi:hypothetical protein
LRVRDDGKNEAAFPQFRKDLTRPGHRPGGIHHELEAACEFGDGEGRMCGANRREDLVPDGKNVHFRLIESAGVTVGVTPSDDPRELPGDFSCARRLDSDRCCDHTKRGCTEFVPGRGQTTGAVGSGGDLPGGRDEERSVDVEADAPNTRQPWQSWRNSGWYRSNWLGTFPDGGDDLLSDARTQHVYWDSTKGRMQDQERIIPRTARLLERMVILVFGVSVVIALMFVAGNYQDFSDQTQLQLLLVLQAFSASVAIAAIALVLLLVIEVVGLHRYRRAWRVGGFLFVAAASVGLAVGSSSLIVLLQPL